MKNSEYQLPNSLTRQAGSIMHKFLLAVSLVCLLSVSTEADIIGLGDLPGGAFGSGANGVSDNGSFVVGSSDGEAMVWSQASGMIGLGNLPGAFYESTAWGTSADGSVVAGRGSNPNNYEAFLWTASGGMVGLGFLPGDVASAGGACQPTGQSWLELVGTTLTEPKPTVGLKPVGWSESAIYRAAVSPAIPGQFRPMGPSSSDEAKARVAAKRIAGPRPAA